MVLDGGNPLEFLSPDGEAPTPTAPLRSRARLAWLFTNARAWSAQRAALSTLGLTAFLEA
jgi:hypothetical protein